MSSNVPQSGHGASPFTGPNQVLVSNSLNGERTIFDLNSVPVGSLLGRTATGIGVYPTTGGGGGPTALTLDDLTDVRTTSPEPTVGQVLTYDGTEWVPNDAFSGTFADGTVGAPSITFTADTNTGFFRPASDTVGVTAGGTRVASLSQTSLAVGNLASAVSSSLSYGISVNASGTFAAVFGQSSTAAGNAATVVGINSAAAGGDSIALGSQVSAAGNRSTAIGQNSTASGANSVAIGDGATTAGEREVSLAGTTSGTFSTALGQGSTASATAATATGASATASGSRSFAGGHLSSATGATSIAIGPDSRASSTNSVSIGTGAGSANMGAATIAIGRAALSGTMTSSPTGIVAIGDGAMRGNLAVAATNTVAIGTNALAAMTGLVSGNTVVGHNACNTVTGASDSVAIGSSAQVGSAAHQTCIGAGTSCTAAGAIAIGRSSLGVGASATISNGLAFPASLATVAPGLAVQFNAGAMGPTTSSIRYKKDVTLASVAADAPGELKPFDNIRVVEYDSKVDGDNNRYLGIIAEELVDLVHPSLIPRDVEGNPAGISYDRLVCVAIQEIQLLRRRVAALEGVPLPALGEYTPIDASKLYDDDQIDDETLTTQKQQYRARYRQLRIDRLVERVEKNPSRESAILNTLNKTTRDAVRKVLEDKATAEAARETAEREARLDALARKKMVANVDLETVGPKMKSRIEALLEKDRLALEVATAARLEAQAALQAAEEEERRLEEEAENDE